MENPYELSSDINLKLDKTITEEFYLENHPFVRKKVNNIIKKHKEELSKEQVSKIIKYKEQITVILYHTEEDLFPDPGDKKSYIEFTSQRELEWLNKLEESKNKAIEMAKILLDNLENEDEISFFLNKNVIYSAESFNIEQIKREELKNKIRPNSLEWQNYYERIAIKEESFIINSKLNNGC